MAKEKSGMKKLCGDGQFCACFNLRKATRAVTQFFDEKMRSLGYRSTQLTILGVTSKMGAMTMNELAEVTVTDRTTLTRNLKPLERDGLIEIQIGKDKRKRKIQVTSKGRKIMERAYGIWQKAQAQLIENMGASRFERMIGDLHKALEAAQVA